MDIFSKDSQAGSKFQFWNYKFWKWAHGLKFKGAVGGRGLKSREIRHV